jgi:hypothetical protein
MWYSRVVADLGNIPDFIAHFESELTDAKRDCKIGGLVEKNITALPGITEHRFNQLQEIEAVLNFLNIQLRKIRTDISRNILKVMLVRSQHVMLKSMWMAKKKLWTLKPSSMKWHCYAIVGWAL